MPNKLPNSQGLSLAAWAGGVPPSREELRARQLERREANKRVDDLKTKLFRLTEGHMEQTVRILRSWLKQEEKNVGTPKGR